MGAGRRSTRLSTWPPGRRTPVARPRTKVRRHPDPDECYPTSPVLLAVDQKFAEVRAFRRVPEPPSSEVPTGYGRHDDRFQAVVRCREKPRAHLGVDPATRRTEQEIEERRNLVHDACFSSLLGTEVLRLRLSHVPTRGTIGREGVCDVCV